MHRSGYAFDKGAPYIRRSEVFATWPNEEISKRMTKNIATVTQRLYERMKRAIPNLGLGPDSAVPCIAHDASSICYDSGHNMKITLHTDREQAVECSSMGIYGLLFAFDVFSYCLKMADTNHTPPRIMFQGGSISASYPLPYMLPSLPGKNLGEFVHKLNHRYFLVNGPLSASGRTIAIPGGIVSVGDGVCQARGLGLKHIRVASFLMAKIVDLCRETVDEEI